MHGDNVVSIMIWYAMHGDNGVSIMIWYAMHGDNGVSIMIWCAMHGDNVASRRKIYFSIICRYIVCDHYMIQITVNKKIAGSKECSPKWLLAIKGRSCNPTPLVHKDMIKKTAFYEKDKER